MGKCVLEIRDEVNVKFVGLDVKTRRTVSDAVKYFLPYAYPYAGLQVRSVGWVC